MQHFLRYLQRHTTGRQVGVGYAVGYAASLFVVPLCVATLIAVRTAQADDQLEFNPLMSLQQQLSEVIHECAAHPLDRVCEERKAAIKDDIKKLRKSCRTNPSSPKCEALYVPRREYVNQIQIYCMQNPHERKCVRFRELSKRKRTYLAKYCQVNPDAPRCQPHNERPKGLAGMLEYCQVYPEKRQCISFMKRLEKARKAPVDEDTNGF